MGSFSELAAERQKVKDLYDLAIKKGLTTWEINFLKSIKACIDGERRITPSMMSTLQDIAVPKTTIVPVDDEDDWLDEIY